MNREQRYEQLVQLYMAQDRLVTERTSLMLLANAVLFAVLNVDSIRGAVAAVAFFVEIAWLYLGITALAGLDFLTREILKTEAEARQHEGIFSARQRFYAGLPLQLGRMRLWQRQTILVGILFPAVFLVAWSVLAAVLIF